MTDDERLLSELPEDGTRIGNAPLMRRLQWPEHKYYRVRDRLLERGILVKGPGQGGSVQRADAGAEEQALRAELERLGGQAGNTRLFRALGWNQDRYFTVRDRLIDQGELAPGRGRGGSVRFATEEVEGEPVAGQSEHPSEAPELQDDEVLREQHLYGPIARVLSEEWSRDKRFKWHHVEITARQGRRSTGGRWTRPDIAVLSLRRYRYVPGLHLEVWTFEIKTTEAVDVSSVYEAVAHARFATRSYLVFPWPARPTPEQSERLDAIRGEAERHGIGLIVFVSPGDYETWQEHVPPARTRAEFSRIDEFIAQQISDEAKSDLQEQLR